MWLKIYSHPFQSTNTFYKTTRRHYRYRMTTTQNCTIIYKKSSYGEVEIGYLDENNDIYANTGQSSKRIGYINDAHQVFRTMQYDDRELGEYNLSGTVRSHGLFEGGELGWIDDDGIVIRAGLIFEEEEVGRVDGHQQEAAGAALLLLFLPDDFEANKTETRR